MKKTFVDAALQEAVLYDGDAVVRRYRVSTAKNGLGCTANSDCTPIGKLRIAEKIGEGLPIGTVFRSRAPTKDVWSSDPSNPLSSSTDDLVLSRILWLGGAEAQNANTHRRYVYIHGTNHENLLGQPASHGCIRMRNTDVIELFDLVAVGNEVDVTAGGDEVA